MMTFPKIWINELYLIFMKIVDELMDTQADKIDL